MGGERLRPVRAGGPRRGPEVRRYLRVVVEMVPTHVCRGGGRAGAGETQTAGTGLCGTTGALGAPGGAGAGGGGGGGADARTR